MSSVIASNVRRIIQDRGLKYSAVAARAGMTSNQLSALLCGRRVIRDTDIVAIVNALEITPNDIFEKRDNT